MTKRSSIPWMTVFVMCLLFLFVFLPYALSNELSIFSDTEPFTVHIPIRIGLVGFNSTSLYVDPKPFLRSLAHTLPSYTPINLDTGKPFNVQYRYLWDVYHVDESIQNDLEKALGTAIRPTNDINNKPVYSNNPRKVNINEQVIPLSAQETTSIQASSLEVGNTSPLFEVDISEVDLQLSAIVYKSLSSHLKLRTMKNSPEGYKQTKKGADKEYSIFIMNPRRERIMEEYIKLTGDSTNPHASKNDYLYGYTTRRMQEVINARRRGLSGNGHFGAYSYTNTWIASGRVIFADLQAVSSVGTTLDRADYFLEELLSNIYKTMTNTPTVGSQQQNMQQEPSIQSNSYGTSIDLLHSGLISWRSQQDQSVKGELNHYYSDNQAGRITATSRANSIVPSMFDTSSLSAISANPSQISTLQQYGIARPTGGVRRGTGTQQAPPKHQIGARITPLLATFVASATKQGITTDMSTPAQQIPFFGRTENSLNTAKQYIETLKTTILTVPIMLLTDHSYNLQLSDVVDMPIIEKMLGKLALSSNIKVIPLLHNIHTFPAISTALFGSLDSVAFSTHPAQAYYAPQQRTILNGDVVSAALLKTSHANPILASVVPSTSIKTTDIVQKYIDSFKSQEDTNAQAVPIHETIPVFLFSLIALPQETTIIYPSHINPDATGTNQNSYILHLHDIHSTKNAQKEDKDTTLAMLRKELTLKVLDSLITRLTGTIPPYLKYKMNELTIKYGLTSPHLVTNQESTIAIDGRPSSQRFFSQHTQSEITETRKQQMRTLLTNVPGKSLSQYIDSTWALGLHPFGPYSTLYKYTKLYRDASKRNVLINTVSQLIGSTWKTIHNTCSFISSYGFLMSNLKPGYLSTYPGVFNLYASNFSVGMENSNSWNDIVGFVKEQGILESQLNCIMYFTQGYLSPPGVELDVDGNLKDSPLVDKGDGNLVSQDKARAQTNMAYVFKRKYVKNWLIENNIKLDERMLDYLAVHPNAPIYVLQQIGWFVESLSLVDRQLDILQHTLDNNINFSKSNKHANYQDYWTDVYTQLYLLTDKVATLGDVSSVITTNIKSSYASCRVVQITKERDFSGMGLGDSEKSAELGDESAQIIHNVKYQAGIGGSSDSSTMKSALSKSTTKSSRSIIKIIAFCLCVAAIVIVVLFTCIFSCLDVVTGGINKK